MTKKKQKKSNDNGFLTELAREVRELWRAFRYALSISGLTFRNQQRRIRGLRLDYVIMPVSGSLPERSGPPRSFLQRQLPLPPEPLSLETLNRRLAAIGDAANVKGVVFVFQGLSAGLATLHNLRTAMTRLRDAGKEIVVYTPYVDLRHYFVASAADRLIIPPTATFDVLGLRAEAIYLKDALAKVGIQAEVIQISPYKTAGNMLTHADMTPEEREQLNWLLDDTYDVLTSCMAEGRGLDQDTLLALIDQAPLTAEATLAGGLVDDLAYEDTLPYLLAQPKDERTEEGVAETGSQPTDEETRPVEESKRDPSRNRDAM